MRHACVMMSLLISLPFTAVADTNSKTTNDFVQMCDAAVPDVKCLLEYETAVDALNWMGDPKYVTCEPDVPITVDRKTSDDMLRAQVVAVVQWLKQNPGYGTQSEVEGVDAALHAVYPCKKWPAHPKAY